MFSGVSVSDIDRLKEEYRDREHRFRNDDRYSPSNPAYQFMKSQLRMNILQMLQRHELPARKDICILEVGCGNGNILADLDQLDENHKRLFGIDLIFTRLQQARQDYSFANLVCSDGQRLPHPAEVFDVVCQFTAFSSILDGEIRRRMAREMVRVLKPGGLILWYDFWLNPFNRQTRGIRPTEVRRLFTGGSFRFQKITLAPPIARLLVPFSTRLGLLLEGTGVLNTHYLAAIRPKMESSL
jgi:ubiquinone/menaquinone biosynthesis C-methylase UbiE